MDEINKREHITVRVKQLLQDNGIKLWLPPYHRNEDINNLTISDEILELAAQYHETLNIHPQLCSEILLELQKKSLQRLVEREEYKEKGVATVRVKVSGQNTPEFSIHLKLSSPVEALAKSISEKINVAAGKLKLIANGKILKFDHTLEQHGVKHGVIVLVIVLPTITEDMTAVVGSTDEEILQETKKDLEFLTGRASKDFFSVTDQAGHFLNIPEESRKHLLSAMTLHEKGRSAFKRNTYSLALLYFLEADNEFKMCQSDLLNRVDNYALLNLDIVWCYLHLQSFHYLSDAEARLKICDETFKRCYGENLERVLALKGTSGNESVLLVRLHLLQAILHHLQNRKEKAKNMFQQVESEMQQLKVDENKIMDLVTKLHCTQKEARLGLRASYNDLNAAFEFILKEREIRKRRRDIEKLKRITNHCICRNGSCVDAERVKELTEMGYSQMMAICSLINSSNDLNGAIMWINNFRQHLSTLYPSVVVDVIMTVDIKVKKFDNIFNKHKYELNDKCVFELVIASLGIEEAANIFPDKLDVIETISTLPATPGCSSFTTNQQTAAHSSGILTQSKLNGITSKVQKNNDGTSLVKYYDSFTEEEENACYRLKEDMSDTADDYLDTSFEMEEKFLNMYKSLLS